MMRIILVLVTNLIILMNLFSQDSLNRKLYEVETGIITYKIQVHKVNVKNGKMNKKASETIDVQMSFEKYGEIVSIQFQTPGQNKTQLIKVYDKQFILENDSLKLNKTRQYDFDFEKIILNEEYYCKECIIKTAKKIETSYLSLNCQKFYMFYSKDLPNRGILTVYKNLPLEIKFRRDANTILIIKAQNVDFETKPEISFILEKNKLF